MKMPRPAMRGSMGIPEEMRPERVFAKEDQPTQEAPMFEGDGDDYQQSMAAEEPAAVSEEVKQAAQAAKDSDPREILKRIGTELTDEDVNKLLFKGYIDKQIKICYDPLGKKAYVATFKTLTAQEYDEVDELLAEEMDRLKMTVNGRDARRSTWLLAFAMTHINGMPLQKPITKKVGSIEMVDTLETGKSRIKIIRALAPMILDKAARIYAAFTTAVALILEDPEQTLLKKP